MIICAYRQAGAFRRFGLNQQGKVEGRASRIASLPSDRPGSGVLRAIAFHEKAGRSQEICFSLGMFLSRRVATVAILPSAL